MEADSPEGGVTGPYFGHDHVAAFRGNLGVSD